jgi:hypothetical protein
MLILRTRPVTRRASSDVAVFDVTPAQSRLARGESRHCGGTPPRRVAVNQARALLPRSESPTSRSKWRFPTGRTRSTCGSRPSPTTARRFMERSAMSRRRSRASRCGSGRRFPHPKSQTGCIWNTARLSAATQYESSATRSRPANVRTLISKCSFAVNERKVQLRTVDEPHRGT